MMPILVERKPALLCSFCGKSEDEVQGMVAGAVASICSECIAVALDEIERQTKGRTGPRVTVDASVFEGSCDDPRLVAGGYKVCGSGGDTSWHWRGPDGRWHDGFSSEGAAVNDALRDLKKQPRNAEEPRKK